MDFRTKYTASTQQLLDARQEIINFLNTTLQQALKQKSRSLFPKTIYGLEVQLVLSDSNEENSSCYVVLSETRSPKMYIDNESNHELVDLTLLVDQCILKISEMIVSSKFDDENQTLSDKIMNILNTDNWDDLTTLYPYCHIKKNDAGFSYYCGTPKGQVLRSMVQVDRRNSLSIDKMENTNGYFSREIEHNRNKNTFCCAPDNKVTSSVNVLHDLIHDYLIEDLTLLHLRGDFNAELKTAAAVLYRR